MTFFNSKQRHNMLFRSKSETNLNVDEASSASSMNHPEAREIPAQVTMTTQEFRPKSWSHIDAQNEMWSQDNQGMSSITLQCQGYLQSALFIGECIKSIIQRNYSSYVIFSTLKDRSNNKFRPNVCM